MTATAVATPCAKYQATATKFVIPPIAGPRFLPPGVKNMIIAVLIIGVLLIGLIVLGRRFRPPGPPIKGTDLERPPGPPVKGTDINKPPGPPN